MSLLVTTDIKCDKCGNWEHGDVGRKAEAYIARQVVHEKGWRRVKQEGKMLDLCPLCYAEYKQQLVGDSDAGGNAGP